MPLKRRRIAVFSKSGQTIILNCRFFKMYLVTLIDTK